MGLKLPDSFTITSGDTTKSVRFEYDPGEDQWFDARAGVGSPGYPAEAYITAIDRGNGWEDVESITDLDLNDIEQQVLDKILEIDSRTSDAVALAIRFRCPIFTYETIMSAAGIVMKEEEEDNSSPFLEDKEAEEATDMSTYTLDELQDLLDKAVDNEEYEKASQLRDEINRRKKKK